MVAQVPDSSTGSLRSLVRDAGVLTLVGLVLGIFIAAGAVVVYLSFPARPDIREIRDLGVLVGFEVAALSLAVSALIRVTARRPEDQLPYAL